MADSTLAGLTAASAASGADLLYLSQSSTSKKIDITTFLANLADPIVTTNTLSAGATTINGDLTFSSTEPDIIGNDDDGFIGITGGTALSGGANAIFYGATHSSNAKDTLFRADGDTWLQWDDSASTAIITGTLSAGATTVQDTSATSTTLYANDILTVLSNTSGADTSILMQDGVTYSARIAMKDGNLYFSPSASGTALTLTTSAATFAGDVALGDTSTDHELTITTGTASWGSLYFNDGADAGRIYYRHDTNLMGLTVNGGTTAQTWDSSGNSTFAGSLQADRMVSTGVQPKLDFVETGVTANNTTWRMTAEAEDLYRQVANDGLSSFTTYEYIQRTANNIDAITWTADAFTLTGDVGIGANSNSDDLSVERSTAGSSTRARIKNTSNTANSTARLILQNGGSLAGDCFVTFDGQTTNGEFMVGVDAQSSAFKIAQADLGEFNGTNEYLTIDGATGNATFAADATVNYNLTQAAVDTILETDADIVDVFIYDTRNDSDSGAWRYKTEHTSWYNETLNDADRGVSARFPEVALIVTLSDTITIYDALDLDSSGVPEMWMVISTVDNGIIADTGTSSGVSMNSLSILNGTLVVTGSGTNGKGMYELNFIRDDSHHYTNTDKLRWSGNIGDRASGGTWTSIDTTNQLADVTSNDVAITVLPGAPIDADTGLPTPTIAVATNGGVSVIADSGSPWDITISDANYNYIQGVDFYGDKVYLNSSYQGTANSAFNYITPAPTADIALTFGAVPTNGSFFRDSSVPGILNEAGAGSSLSWNAFKANDEELFIGGDSGLTKVAVDDNTSTASMVAYITSSYNTGWMPGDIRGAWLSDGDSTTMEELVSNPGPTFTVTTGWTTSGTGTLTVSSGDLSYTGASAATWEGFRTTVSVIEGKTYEIITNVATIAGTWNLRASAGDSQHNTDLVDQAMTSGINTASFVAPSTGTVYLWINNQQTDTITLDYYTVTEMDTDRSVKGNNLTTNGTVTKSVASTGTDLMAYSGWSNSNYLSRAYDADLDFGTGDFSVAFWFKESSTSGNRAMFERIYWTGAAYSGSSFAMFSISGILRWEIGNNAWAQIDVADSPVDIDDDVWHHAVGTREGSSLKLYLDGRLVTTTTIANATGTLDNASATLDIGDRSSHANASEVYTGSLSLLRISAYAPSAAQIKKMYNDEKHLFKSGAQCMTAADAITGLGYDEDSDKLYVTTASGMSVMRGLEVIDTVTSSGTPTVSTFENVSAARNMYLANNAAEAVIYEPAINNKETQP